MDTRSFPIDNVDGWFENSLDHTQYPDWYVENDSPSKRLERAAQILKRQMRFNEYVRVDIDDIWAALKALSDAVDAVNKRLDEFELRFTEIENENADLKNRISLLSSRLNTAEAKATAQETQIDALRERILTQENLGATLSARSNEDRTKLLAFEIRLLALEKVISNAPESTPKH